MGDTIALDVNLKLDEAEKSSAHSGTYGDGQLEIEVNGRYVCDTKGSPVSWRLPIVGMTHQRYHVVAAVRTPGVVLVLG